MSTSTTEETHTGPERGLRVWLPYIGAVATILSVIVTGAALLIQSRSESRELTVRTLSIQELTATAQIEGLEGQYFYQGKEIDQLWSVRLAIINTGDKTIVGTGQATNLIGESLDLTFRPEMGILSTEADPAFAGATISANTDSGISVKFGQWHAGESIVVVLLLASDADVSRAPAPLLLNPRPLIDGRVIFEEASVEANVGRETLLFRLIGRWELPLRIGALVPLVLADLVVVTIAVEFVWGFLKLQVWLVRYSNRWTAFIWEQDLGEPARDRVLANPSSIHDRLFRPEWADEVRDKWEHIAPPNPIIKTWLTILKTIAVCLVIGILLMAATLSLL